MTDSHTYINTDIIAASNTDDTVDIDFLTDANVYYNLPPPLPLGHCRGASLPRGRFAAQPKLTRESSSCPASPKLSAATAALIPSDVNSRDKGAGEALAHAAMPPPTLPSRRNDATQESGGKDTPSLQSKARGSSKPRSKMLSHTRSFDLDHIYQNLVRVASRPRSNSFSIDLPWRRKKKVVDTTPPGIREDSGEDAHIGLEQQQASLSKPEPLEQHQASLSKPEPLVQHQASLSKSEPLEQHQASLSMPEHLEQPQASLSMPEPPENLSPQPHEDHGCQARCSSSSSTSSSSSENDCVADDCSAEVRPGVTYLRKHRTKVEQNISSEGDAVNVLYHSTATLPLHARRVPSAVDSTETGVDQRPMLDVNANLDEWLRKERWLEKKRCSRNFRSANESGEVDISILHASDGGKWKNYLYEVFTQLDRTRGIRVEASNVEDIEEDLGRLQAVKMKGAKLQIVIMSPCFLDHIAGHAKSELGQVFRPVKVLALLLGVDDCQLNMAHLSALYSYSDWHKLKVRDMDRSFVYEVLGEGIKILNNSELYSKYQDERSARFKVTPRKVTEMQQLVHLMLSDPVNSKRDIEIFIEGPSKPNVMMEKFRMRNPYTIEFRMPDEFMVGSSLLLVTVLVQRRSIGSRQLKCETSLDSMKALLTTVSNPTFFMCQALNINPTSDELDLKLTETVRTHVPLSKLKEQRTDKCCSAFPTWVHFSAFYGLERLTWALLEIPGGEAALNRPNQHGHTPSVLAYQKGFHQLAHTLEDAALIASLAAKLNYAPVNYKNLSKAQSPYVAEETYSSPPPPRPLNSPLYDTPPSPLEVPKQTVEASSVEMSKPSHVSLQPPPGVEDASPAVCESPLPHHCPQHPSATTSLTPSDQTDIRKQGGRYLDMKSPQGCRESECYEHSEDVYTLVSAWLEKTNIKAFVEKHQEKIGEVKIKLDLSVSLSREENYNAESELGASGKAAPEADGAAVPDLEKQENMVEEFFTLMTRGPCPPCDLPNDRVEDSTHQATNEPKDKPASRSASASREIFDEQSQLTASSPPPSGLKTPPNKMPPTESIEERLPEPPPRPTEPPVYLEPAAINLPKETEVTANKDCSKYFPEINTSPFRSRSNSVERVTHAQDQTPEMLYAIIK